MRVNGWTCNGDHSPDKCPSKGKAWTLLDPRAYSWHDPESGETRPTNDEPVRAPIDGTGDLADYFVPASKPQFSNSTVRPAPSGPEPTNSPEVPKDLPKTRRGESPLAPSGHSTTANAFFHGPPLFQSGSNKGSFGTHQYHHMRCRNQASYCFVLAKQTPKALTPCFWAGSPVWRVTSLP